MRGGPNTRGGGRGGFPGYMAGGRGGHQGQMGHYGQPRDAKPPDTYVCNRCGVPGHFIHDCPKNNDKNYDPSKFKGVPKNQQWQVATANPEQFRANMDKTMRSLVESATIYSTDDFSKRPDELEPEGGAEGKQDNPGRFPPALLCQLCYRLMDEASLTPCCQLSCCFGCIQLKVVASLNSVENQELEDNSRGMCPMCHGAEMSVAKIIPNTQMQGVIKWFLRQRAFRAKVCPMGLKKTKSTATEKEGEQSESDEDEQYDKQKLQHEIDQLISDHTERKRLEATLDKERKEAEAVKEQERKDEVSSNGRDIEKFDKSKHAGTVYDAATGRRVPVTSESQLPKPKSNAETIMELQQEQKLQEERARKQQSQIPFPQQMAGEGQFFQMQPSVVPQLGGLGVRPQQSAPLVSPNMAAANLPGVPPQQNMPLLSPEQAHQPQAGAFAEVENAEFVNKTDDKLRPKMRSRDRDDKSDRREDRDRKRSREKERYPEKSERHPGDRKRSPERERRRDDRDYREKHEHRDDRGDRHDRDRNRRDKDRDYRDKDRDHRKRSRSRSHGRKDRKQKR